MEHDSRLRLQLNLMIYSTRQRCIAHHFREKRHALPPDDFVINQQSLADPSGILLVYHCQRTNELSNFTSHVRLDIQLRGPWVACGLHIARDSSAKTPKDTSVSVRIRKIFCSPQNVLICLRLLEQQSILVSKDARSSYDLLVGFFSFCHIIYSFTGTNTFWSFLKTNTHLETTTGLFYGSNDAMTKLENK